MNAQETIRIDDIKWWITDSNAVRVPVPLCPEHHLRLQALPPRVRDRYGAYKDGYEGNAVKLECADGPHQIDIPRKYDEEKLYVINRIDAKIFKGMKVINLDDEAVPLAKDKAVSKDGSFFITTQLMESKRGLQAVIYAGEKGSTSKTQIFIEPEVKRLAFDPKDLHPTDVFLKIEAIFSDGSKQSIEQ